MDFVKKSRGWSVFQRLKLPKSKLLALVCKVFLALALVFLLYLQFQGRLGQLDWEDWHFLPARIYLIQYFSLVLILWPFNWFLEISKWRYLCKDFIRLTWFQASLGVFAGLALALFSPNRLGQTAGRLWFLPRDWLKAARFSLWVNAINWWWIALMGFWAYGDWSWVYWFGAAGIWFLPYVLPRAWFWASWRSYVYLTCLVILRYAVYFFQYVFLMYALGADVSWFLLAKGIALIFLVQTGLPLPSGLGLLLRSNLSLWIFWDYLGLYDLPLNLLLGSALLLWGINVVLPALLGWLLIAWYGGSRPLGGD